MKPFFRIFLAFFPVLFAALPLAAQSGKAKAGLRTVVIDPGHGGEDAGCISRDKKTYEKTIALDIAKRLRDKIQAEWPDVKVVMTRQDDRFIKLQDRGHIANKAGGDLFISVHVNATDKGTSANGYSVHCLGKSSNKNRDIFNENLNLVKRENAVVKLEQDYRTTYQGFDPDDPESSILFTLMQNAHLTNSLDFADAIIGAMKGGPIKNSRGVSQDPFLVLAKAAMPAVLVEVGFMTNPQDLAVIRTESGRDEIAANICKAFGTYKRKIDDSVKAEKSDTPQQQVQPSPEEPSKQLQEAAPKEETPAASDGGIRYGVQVLVSSKKLDKSDPFFAGYEPLVLPAGKVYKYIIAVGDKLAPLKKEFGKFQKKFPDCYLVKIEDGKTSPVR